MKLLLLTSSLLLCLATVTAHADIFRSISQEWASSFCYYDSNQINLTSIQEDAKRDACDQAKEKCYMAYGTAHPNENFHCEAVASDIIYTGIATRTPSGNYCSSSSYVQGYAKVSCVVESIRGRKDCDR